MSRNLILFFVFLSFGLFSQTPKKFFSEGENFEDKKQYLEAIAEYSKALELDVAYVKAYLHRAACYEKLGKNEEAAIDYKSVFVLKPTDKTYAYLSGRAFEAAAKFENADEMIKKALALDKEYKSALEAEIRILIELKNFAYALTLAQIDLDLKKTPESCFYYAFAQDSAGNSTEAERYYKYALDINPKYEPAITNLIYVLVKREKIEEAFGYCTTLINANFNHSRALYARSLIYGIRSEFQKGIADLSKVIAANPNQYMALLKRAEYYEALNQFPYAIEDYGVYLQQHKENVNIFIKRAEAYEKIAQKKAAIEDYKTVLRLAQTSQQLEKTKFNLIVDRLYELNREDGKPEIELSSLILEEGALKIYGIKKTYSISGKIKDLSLIKEISVNSGTVSYKADSLNPEFRIDFTDINKMSFINIRVSDVYDNTGLLHIDLKFIEIDPPQLEFEAPFLNADGDLILEIEGTSLFMKGRVRDASLIASLIIDDLPVVYDSKLLNPEFTTTIKIENKDSVTIIAEDIIGNKLYKRYRLNRNALIEAQLNPMGKTWAVFIENSVYQEFPSLEGPAKDVLAISSALANYKIANTIHKKNLTKVELDYFFTIELRDLVKKNNVSSLFIWYAGHGKFVSPTGYWIPADGKPDDEYSYYSINGLRVAMQSYPPRLNHILVITDACESGATFLMAMRGSIEDEKSCSNKDLTRSKSAQVFTSAGFELASDNSYFTKGFVSALNNNDEACLAIEKIVKKVSTALLNNGRQTPKFGRIKDLEDEGGTFFFIKN